MNRAVTVEQMRAAEAVAIAQVGDDALMQRAAAGLAGVVGREVRARAGKVAGTTVLVLVGTGNNGGDGLFAGMRLARRGVRVLAVRAGLVHERGWQALMGAGGREVSGVQALAALRGGRVDLVVDAILGIGGRPGLRAPWDDFARVLADIWVPVVACDLPSGVCADPPFGVSEGAVYVRADVTVTFGERKLCHIVEPARSACGRVEVIDIGLGDCPATVLAWEPGDVAAVWPVPGVSSDKYARGVVGVDAGSARYPGAGVLACTGAVYAGAGMVRYTGASQVASRVVEALPNVVVGDGRVQARVLGCGWGERTYGEGVVAQAVESGVPLVVDADGLRYLPARAHPGVLLTPHAGELARLLDASRDEVEADPLAAVHEAADRLGATVLLKGSTQMVASPGDDAVHVAVPGPAWTAQAGSGDVLAGVCGALLAAGLSATDAALAAASLQAMTAASHPGPLPPQELARWFQETIAGLAATDC